MNTYKNFVHGISVVPKASTESNVAGEIEYLLSDNKLRLYNGTINDPIVTEADTATLTNKSLSGSSNTFTNIPNAALVHSSITINGTTANLGDSIIITASTTNTLTIGTGLSGGSFNGSAPVTIAIDSTVVTLTGTQTLTNKTIAAGSNTITGLTNSNLSGSAAISNANLAVMAAHTYKGNNTGSSATPVDVTSTQLTADLNLFTSSLQGLVPASGGGTTNFLRADGTFATPPGGSSNLTVSAVQTTTYAILSTDQVVLTDASPGSFTVTLPDATTLPGKQYWIKRVDQTLANSVQISTTSSQRIDGAVFRLLSTQYEEFVVVSDGSNWQILDHLISGATTSFVPTASGFGTITSQSAYWYRNGRNLRMFVTFTSGVSAASPAQVDLPAGLVADGASYIFTNAECGNYGNQNSVGRNDKGGFVLPVISGTYVQFGDLATFGGSTSTTVLTPKNGADIAVVGDIISLDFEVPIAGWEG